MSRHLASAPPIAHLLLLAVGPVVAMSAGGTLAGLALCAISALLAWSVTPLRAGGKPEMALVFAFDLLAVVAAYGLRRGRESAREKNGLHAVLRTILDVIPTGIAVVTRHGRVVYASREAERICGPELRGPHGLGSAGPVRLLATDGRPISASNLAHAAETGNAGATGRLGGRQMIVVRADERRVTVEYRVTPVRAGGQLVVMLFHEVEAPRLADAEESYDDVLRRRREEREEMLQRIGEHLRGSVDPHRIQSIAAEELGIALNADRCFFLLFEIDDHAALMGPQWCAPGIAALVDEYEAIELDVERLYRHGVTRISHDMRSSSLPALAVNVFENRLGVRSAINVPLYGDSGNATGALVVAMANQTRAWSADEVAMAELVATQTRFVIEAARLLAAERSRAEREQLSNTIGALLRRAPNPASIQAEATRELGRSLDVDRCYYIQYELSARRAIVGPDYSHGPHTLTLTGDYELPHDPAILEQLSLARETVVVEDATVEDPLDAHNLVALKSETLRSFVRVPILFGNEPTAALVVGMTNRPREWSADEVGLVESVAAQTWAAIGNAQIIAHARMRAEREELLSRITIAIGQAKSVREAQAAATSLLGRQLKADRCYVVEMDYQRDTAAIATEYRRTDLEQVAGRYEMETPEMNWIAGLAASGEAFCMADMRKSIPDDAVLGEGVDSLLRRRRHRALLVVPDIVAGRIESLLVLAMAEKPREWSPDEIDLAQEVAIRMRVALQSTVTHEREHQIAKTLQQALLPTVKDDLPGLGIAHYYRAAFVESSIGGDFFDAFKIGPARTAICIGDVSGKGLDAAAQLSTLRSMMRAMLYRNHQSLADAVEELNRIVVEHRLLNGFATMFIGIFDTSSRRLSYVSCGQEPAILVRAAGGKPRVLAPTAPALGVFESEEFEEGVVTLGRGDLLLLYTDGVSEVGKGGRGMLGVSGLAQIMLDAAPEARADVKAGLTAMVERVEQHSDGLYRDDLCMLLARAR